MCVRIAVCLVLAIPTKTVQYQYLLGLCWEWLKGPHCDLSLWGSINCPDPHQNTETQKNMGNSQENSKDSLSTGPPTENQRHFAESTDITDVFEVCVNLLKFLVSLEHLSPVSTYRHCLTSSHKHNDSNLMYILAYQSTNFGQIFAQKVGGSGQSITL